MKPRRSVETSGPSGAASGRSIPVRLVRTFAGALAWGLLMVLCAVVSLWLRNRLETLHLGKICAVFFAGGVLAWPVALGFAHILRGRRSEARFAAAFVLLAVGTIGSTAFVFAMEYRLFYAQWHQPFGTRVWMFQFFFTSLGAVYQFAVMGLGLYLPAGLPVLTAASLWLAQAPR